MKKLILLGLIALVLCGTAITAYDYPALTEQCKATGDFTDNKAYDLELLPIGTGTSTIFCYDPVEGRHYEITDAAVRTAMR